MLDVRKGRLIALGVAACICVGAAANSAYWLHRHIGEDTLVAYVRSDCAYSEQAVELAKYRGDVLVVSVDDPEQYCELSLQQFETLEGAPWVRWLPSQALCARLSWHASSHAHALSDEPSFPMFVQGDELITVGIEPETNQRLDALSST